MSEESMVGVNVMASMPENLLMMFDLFMLIWLLLAICCSIPKINKYVTKFLEFLAFWPSMLYDWSVLRRMNKKIEEMKNIVNEDPDEKYIKNLNYDAAAATSHYGLAAARCNLPPFGF